MQMNRAKRVTGVENRSDGRRIGMSKDVDEGRRKTEGRESRLKVGMRNPIVSFLLVEEKKKAINGMIVGVAEDGTNMLGDIRSLTTTDEAGLGGVDEPRKDLRKTISEKFRENFCITIGELDGPPIGDGRRRAIR